MQRSPINAQMAKTIEKLEEQKRVLKVELTAARAEGSIQKSLARKYLARIKKLRLQLRDAERGSP